MPLTPETHHRLTSIRNALPAFLDVLRRVFGENEDEQHDALVAEERLAEDDRRVLFRALEEALPVNHRELLRAFDAAWAAETLAREDAAYLIGAAVVHSRPCAECEAERRRTSEVFAGWIEHVEARAEQTRARRSHAARAGWARRR